MISNNGECEETWKGNNKMKCFVQILWGLLNANVSICFARKRKCLKKKSQVLDKLLGHWSIFKRRSGIKWGYPIFYRKWQSRICELLSLEMESWDVSSLDFKEGIERMGSLASRLFSLCGGDSIKRGEMMGGAAEEYGSYRFGIFKGWRWNL